MNERYELTAEVLKVDESLGLVFGWAIVCAENGNDYYDLQGDHIPESVMLEAATDLRNPTAWPATCTHACMPAQWFTQCL